ncbi:MAG: hypothetical protein VX498_14770 [Myxococcota bacterium]|nr:hypothetical protein [Myxococcota bacterium]
MKRVTLLASLVLAAAALLLPSVAAAQYGQGDTTKVGVAFFPFEVDRSEDRALAFALEDRVQKELSGVIRHPVFTGRETNRALQGTIQQCTEDDHCVRLFGSQFNASIAVRVKVFRVGAEIQVETEWYMTGNGIRIGRENTAFAESNSKTLIEALAGWWTRYWDTSLRVSPESRAGEGNLLNSAGRESETWFDQQERTRKERRGEENVRRRRDDFDNSRDTANLFDRSDPTADLRRMVEDDGSESRRSSDDGKDRRAADRRRGRDTDSSSAALPPLDSDDVDLDSRTPAGSRSDRRGSSGRTADFDARDRRGTSPSGQSGDETGMGKREYRRYTRSGLTFDGYQDRRWALKKRVYLRTAAFYGGGYLSRRYQTIVFIRSGGVKTEEYGWESLGGSPVHPGGTLGVGFAPIDQMAVELDLSGMYAKRSLRRLYEGNDYGTNFDDSGTHEDRPSAHLLVDVRARAVIRPYQRFKFSPGLGVTMILMGGFEIPPEPPLNYTSRPTTVVVGLTPVVGFNIAISSFVSFFVDLSGTVYLDQGAADDEFHDFFGGGQESEFTPRFMEPRLQTRPIMGRATVGTMILF